MRAAVERSIPLLQKSATGYTQKVKCFSCHHQALSTLAVTLAKERGVKIDEQALHAQLVFTEASLRTSRDNYKEGVGQGGQVDTAGYALLALDVGGWKADETTDAVIEYLLRRDAERDHWRTSANRPPSELSHFTSTYLAVRALRKFGLPEQRERADARMAKAREWLLKTRPQDTEEMVFRLGALKYAGSEEKAVAAASAELLAAQRPDGGWSQKAGMESDAYATGSAMVALAQVGGLAAADPAYQRGVRFLLRTQKPDGSWHVVSRSKPFQPYFESGFPYGNDQFISAAATGWATAALALAL